MSTLNIININLDVPVDLKVMREDNGIKSMWMFNFTYNVAACYNIVEVVNSEDIYSFIDTYPILETDNGLTYFSFGWKIFDEIVQEKYSGYIVDKEILGDK